ncbi:hypothetical protein CHU92_07445 [Flavobacterium cyanobacteriorum]|uniref:Signal transduction histidine kinase internal region domain-containing protein n=2 Tax=Flavobacterium cyanobacteriorum TaxID=2022802 RepID=A0A255Z8S5_9FLAO|nr:hypothetical protein CHU92_07445 [Flavobacterium cyanobacteriorum]
MAKKTQTLLLHLSCCLIFICIPILSSPDFRSAELFNIPLFKRDFFTYLLLLVFFYANYLYLIPVLYFRKRKVLFFIIAFLSFAAISVVPAILFPFKMPDIMILAEGAKNNTIVKHGLITPFEVGYAFLFLLMFFASLLLRMSERFNYIKSEKLRTEIHYLKAQINPHFLFNTLNSLYALTLAKSNEAPEAVLKLSAMMRYVVSESSNDYVPLEKEIDYIRNYISLQQLRMDTNVNFVFSAEGDFTGRQISPLVLIPFIENAFKYGLNPEKDASIAISIKTNGPELMLMVKNKRVATGIPDEEATRQGMENTKQRLQYLYPKKHKLLIFEPKDTFEVQLTMDLG